MRKGFLLTCSVIPTFFPHWPFGGFGYGYRNETSQPAKPNVYTQNNQNILWIYNLSTFSLKFFSTNARVYFMFIRLLWKQRDTTTPNNLGKNVMISPCISRTFYSYSHFFPTFLLFYFANLTGQCTITFICCYCVTINFLPCLSCSDALVE